MSKKDSFETRLKRLEEIIQALESPDLPLEESLTLYKEGLACSQFCRQALENARHELEIWENGVSVKMDQNLEILP